MKGIVIQGLLSLLCISVTEQTFAQKSHKYTIKSKSTPSVFDSLMKQCFKNKLLRCDSCDMQALRNCMNEYQKHIESSEKDHKKRLCLYANIYHVWLTVSLCKSSGLKRLGNNPARLDQDTLLIGKTPFTLSSLRTFILELSEKHRLQAWCALWDGTVSGASPPKKEWKAESITSMLTSKAKTYFKSSPEEYSLDRSTHTLCLSSTLLNVLGIQSVEGKHEFTIILNQILPFLPAEDAAFCMVNKEILKMRSITVSDRISIDD